MGEQVEVDVAELARQVSEMFKDYAALGKLPREDENGLEVLVGKDGSGMMLFRFVTWDEIQVDIEFSVPDLMRHGRDYMANMRTQVERFVWDERESRVRNSKIHILAGSKGETH